MNLSKMLAFAAKLPVVVAGLMAIVEKFKVPGADKKAVVLASIPESVALLEFGIGMDLLHDPDVATLLSSYIDAEAAVLKVRVALKTLLIKKAPVVTTTPVLLP